MEFIGKTKEEAIELGLKELGLTEEQAEIVVKEEASKGFLGINKKNAVVEITKKKGDLELSAKFLNEILDMLDVNAKVEITNDGENDVLNIITDGSASIIGYRGEVLDALQTLANAYANLGSEKYKKVVVDCESYRTKREETLISLAHKLEDKAADMRREVILEPMSPFERRIIHTALADSQKVKTRSDGKEPNRYVVIVPNDLDELSTPYNAGRNKDSGRKGGKNDKRKGGKRDMKKPMQKSSAKKSSTITFGTYLGNSLKDKQD